MAYPPPVLPTDSTNLTPSTDVHPGLHNSANAAINDIVVRVDGLITEVATIELTPGENGKTVLNGLGAPALTVGVEGDFYLATDTSTLYGPKVEGATPSWGAGVNLVGPRGADGVAGLNGKTVRYGAGAPSSDLGVVDDFYIDTTTYDLYGPKFEGATPTWPLATSLVGPAGPPGQDATLTTFKNNADGTAIIPADNADSWIVGSDRMNRDLADATKDYRAFFNKIKGAFRAGLAADRWDDISVGNRSAGFGYDTTATGDQSFAQGQSTTADGVNSHAEGFQTRAGGPESHAEGWNTTATGQHAHAEGASSTAGGDNAHAEGQGTSAPGLNSHAEGWNTLGGTNAAHAEGYKTMARGFASHAEGDTTDTQGHASHAEGQNTVASGPASHAEGYQTNATGNYAHTEGFYSQATSGSSHAEGNSTLAQGNSAHAQGHSARADRFAQHALASGAFNTFNLAAGDAQACAMVLYQETADATASLLKAGTSAVGTTPPTLTGGAGTDGPTVLTLPVSRSFKVRIDVVARRTDVAGEHAGWSFEGVIARDATGNAYIVGTMEGKAWGTTGAGAWDMTPSINTVDAANNYLALTATGEAAKTIRWVASLNWVEVG